MTESYTETETQVVRDALVLERPVPVAQPEVVKSPNGYGGFVVHHQDYDVEHLPGPIEGARRHAFDDLRGFAAWLKREAAAPDDVDILVDREVVVAFLDPLRAEPERVTCALALDPCFAMVKAILGKPLSQAQMVQFVRTWRDRIDSSDLLASALRTIQVVKGGEFKSEIDETGATRFIGSTDKRDVAVRIPPEITLSTPVFRGVEEYVGSPARYEVELFVTVNLDDGVPVFSLAFPAFEDVYTKARIDAAGFLRTELGDGFLVALGKADVATRKQTTRDEL
jgi:hypothetical protein